MSSAEKPRPKRLRLDQLLVERGLCKSRAAAQRAILAGEVIVDGQLKDKPASAVSSSAKIELKSKPKYVSQGGLKLEKALSLWRINVRDKTCIDIGSSTGGFTDCLLQHGAKKVYAVDVGKGQLDWSLRNDPRVVVMEEINARYLSADQIGVALKLAAIDVSFISLKLILPIAKSLLSETGEIVALVKPQFEAGREEIETGGIITKPAVHQDVLVTLDKFIADELGLSIKGATHSPFKGPAGNIEFLMHIAESSHDSAKIDWSQIVEDAHRELD